MVPRLHIAHLGAYGCDDTSGFVAKHDGGRTGVETLLEVHVAVADARCLDAQQHLFALGLGVRLLTHFERHSPFNDLHRTHADVLHFQGKGRCLRGYFADPGHTPIPLVMSIRVARGGAQSIRAAMS